MQTRPLPETSDARSPAGAEIRYLMGGTTGDMIHSTVPPGQVNRATVHATVSEFWHVLSGRGEIWRRDESGEEMTVLTPGVSIDIPVGTAFQYRCTGSGTAAVSVHHDAAVAGRGGGNRYRRSVGADRASVGPGVVVPVAVKDERAIGLGMADREDRRGGAVDRHPRSQGIAVGEQLRGLSVVV